MMSIDFFCCPGKVIFDTKEGIIEYLYFLSKVSPNSEGSVFTNNGTTYKESDILILIDYFEGKIPKNKLTRDLEGFVSIFSVGKADTLD